jgi:hypothetical protein
MRMLWNRWREGQHGGGSQLLRRLLRPAKTQNVTNEAKRLLKTKDIVFRNHVKANGSMKVNDLFL